MDMATPKTVEGFKAYFEFRDHVEITQAPSIEECFKKLEIIKIPGKCSFKVEQGTKKAELIIYPRVIKKLLANDLSRALYAKKLTLLLK